MRVRKNSQPHKTTKNKNQQKPLKKELKNFLFFCGFTQYKHCNCNTTKNRILRESALLSGARFF